MKTRLAITVGVCKILRLVLTRVHARVEPMKFEPIDAFTLERALKFNRRTNQVAGCNKFAK